MSMILRARKDASSEMNVTPLIDVLLVLLIIFMVLVHNRGEQVEIPPPSSISLPDPDGVIVVVELNNAGEGKLPAVSINRKEVRGISSIRRCGRFMKRGKTKSCSSGVILKSTSNMSPRRWTLPTTPGWIASA
jgi:hypothetical protein